VEEIRFDKTDEVILVSLLDRKALLEKMHREALETVNAAILRMVQNVSGGSLDGQWRIESDDKGLKLVKLELGIEPKDL
jgi:hypothetical protein